jgi:ERCC4-type nuclease
MQPGDPVIEPAAPGYRAAAQPHHRVVVDDREPADAVIAALRRRSDVELGVERLVSGDYRIDDLLLFERKTLPDLILSIKDGRLFQQALRLASAPLRAVVILEGRGRDLAGSGMRREAIQGAISMLTVQLGLPLLRAMDPEETASLMLATARQAHACATGALPRCGQRPRGKRRVQSHILQGLPGIGPARAQRLVERFGSIEAIIAAPAQELARVPGIGETTAAAIRWAVEEPAARYAPGA